MDLHPRDLRFFEIVAELGHLGRAAEQLGRTQPALTKCMQRLEQAVGGSLFERAGRGIQLTPVGQVLLTRARMLRNASQEALREVREFNEGISGHVRIGSGPVAADHLLPELCRKALAGGRKITISIVIGPSWELRDRLREGQLDLLIGLTADGDAELISHPIIEDVVVVAASYTHPIFEKSRITLASLLQHSWALPSANIPSRQWLDQAFTSRGMSTPTMQIEAGSISLLPRMVAKTELLTFVSRHTLRLERSSTLKEIRLPATTLRRHLGVTCRRDGYLSPATRRILQMLRDDGPMLFGSEEAPFEDC